MALDLTPLRNLQTQGYTPGIIDGVFLEIAGFCIPGLIKEFKIPMIQFETVDTEGGFQTRIPTRNIKPVIMDFEVLLVLPAVMALIERSPSLRFRSKKSRLSLVNQNVRYEDGVDVLGMRITEERVAQAYKNVDSTKIEMTVHTFQHKWGDGVQSFECAFYKAQPPQLRIQGKQYVGGDECKSLITW